MKNYCRHYPMFEDILCDLEVASWRYETEEEEHWMRCAAEDIAWYLQTDRAPREWWRALVKADFVKLLRRMAQADDKSRNGQIQIATAYLKRYCGYKV